MQSNLNQSTASTYDQEEVPMAVQVPGEEKSRFVGALEGVIPQIRGRFGAAKIGIFGSTARGEERPESDVDVLVEFAPGQATFRNIMELASFLEDLFGSREGPGHGTGAEPPSPPAGRRGGRLV